MSAESLIDELIKAGTPSALVARVAMELGKAEAERAILAERRQHERDRKARSREVTGQHVTARDSRDNADQPPILDKESFPQTPFKEINPTPDTHTAPARGPIFVCPKSVDPQHWRDFLANRKRKGAANTETAYAGQLKLIEQYSDDEWPPGRLVQLAAEKGWGTIVNPRESEQRNGHGRLVQREAGTPGLGRTQQARDRILAKLGARMGGSNPA
jgi:hypothetical protein